MTSKTMLIDAPRTLQRPHPQDAARPPTRSASANRRTAPPPRPALGHRAGRLASLVHDATTHLTHWIASSSIVLLRLSLGGIFFWFGLLKFFPALSPAEALATRTLTTLTWGYLAPQCAMPLLALWETVIGLGLLLGVYPSLTLGLLFLHMGGTFTPLVLFPHDVFAHIPYAPTFEAQYILKNVVLISAGCVIGASSRGAQAARLPGRPALSPQPQHERRVGDACCAWGGLAARDAGAGGGGTPLPADELEAVEQA
jgi:uncharacterized membrane protein YphA (DoxX/SURF4 family)